MSRRALILPLSAIIIAGLCAYKLSRPEDPRDPDLPVVLTRQAPFFELHDQRKPPQIVRLKSYIGRHGIIVAFFDEDLGLKDPVLVWLRQNAEALRSRNVKVLAISPALPQTHRKMLKDQLAEGEPAPFQMLSDITGSVHRLYGLVDNTTKTRKTGVFLINRAGNLPWSREHPLPLEDPIPELAQQLELE